MEHDSQPEAYCFHVWIRGIHPMLWRRFVVRSDSTPGRSSRRLCRSASTGRTSMFIAFASARRTTPCHGLAGSPATMHGKSSWPTCTFASMNASCMSTISAISGNTRCGSRNGWNREQPVLSGVCGRSMSRASGGLRRTASFSGSARVRAVASQRIA
jgi:hypothetical protein